MFLFEAFQFIIAEKCNIQIIFNDLIRTFIYAINQANTKELHTHNNVAMLDLKPNNSALHKVHSAC